MKHYIKSTETFANWFSRLVPLKMWVGTQVGHCGGHLWIHANLLCKTVFNPLWLQLALWPKPVLLPYTFNIKEIYKQSATNTNARSILHTSVSSEWSRMDVCLTSFELVVNVSPTRNLIHGSLSVHVHFLASNKSNVDNVTAFTANKQKYVDFALLRRQLDWSILS